MFDVLKIDDGILAWNAYNLKPYGIMILNKWALGIVECLLSMPNNYEFAKWYFSPKYDIQ